MISNTYSKNKKVVVFREYLESTDVKSRSLDCDKSDFTDALEGLYDGLLLGLSKKLPDDKSNILISKQYEFVVDTESYLGFLTKFPSSVNTILNSALALFENYVKNENTEFDELCNFDLQVSSNENDDVEVLFILGVGGYYFEHVFTKDVFFTDKKKIISEVYNWYKEEKECDFQCKEWENLFKTLTQLPKIVTNSWDIYDSEYTLGEVRILANLSTVYDCDEDVLSQEKLSDKNYSVVGINYRDINHNRKFDTKEFSLAYVLC